MKSIAKSDAMMRVLKDEIDLRIKGSATIDTSRLSRDADGFPILTLSDNGNEAAGQPVIAIRIKSIDAVSKDVFGNQLYAFSPHIAEIAYELSAAENPTPSNADVALATLMVAKLNLKTQLKQVANTVAVTEAALNATAASLEVDDLIFKNKLN